MIRFDEDEPLRKFVLERERGRLEEVGKLRVAVNLYGLLVDTDLCQIVCCWQELRARLERQLEFVNENINRIEDILEPNGVR